jgi:nuclear pore complex protein Nup62
MIFVSLSTRYNLCSFVCFPYLHYIYCTLYSYVLMSYLSIVCLFVCLIYTTLTALYTLMYACVCVCMYVCMYVCVCVYVCICVCVCMYVCVYVCMYVCMYMCVCVCMYMCVCVFRIILPGYNRCIKVTWVCKLSNIWNSKCNMFNPAGYNRTIWFQFVDNPHHWPIS